MIPSKPGLQLRLYVKSELKKRTLLKYSIIYIFLHHMLNYDYLTVIKLDHYIDYKQRFGSK